jgi:hypothetical protein
MKLIDILVGAIGAAGIAGVFMLLFYYPEYLGWELLGLLVWLTGWTVLKIRQRWAEDGAALWLALGWSLSSFVFLVLLPESWLRWTVAGGVICLSAVWLIYIWAAWSWRNVGKILAWLSFFFFIYSLTRLGDFFNGPRWLILLAIFAGLILVTWPILCSPCGARRKPWLMVLIIAWIVIQLWWCLDYWPTNLLTNSLLLLVGYYVLLSLGELYISQRFEYRKFIQTLSLSALVVVLILVTAHWQLPA